MAIKSFNGFIKGSDTYKCRDDRANNLGTASAKNAISVVTDSTDLVESGAVYDALGFGNKNLLAGMEFGTINQSTGENQTDPTQSTKRAINKIKVKRGSVVTISGFNEQSNKQIRLFYYSTDGYLRTIISNVFSTTYLSITIPSDTDFFRFQVAAVSLGSDYQVEEGNTATAYEPYHASVEESKVDNTVIAPVENGTTASQAYAVGEHMIRGRKFCTVTSPVTTSSTWVKDSNYVEGTIADLCKFFTAGLSSEVGTISNATAYQAGNLVSYMFRFSPTDDIAAKTNIAIGMKNPFSVYNCMAAALFTDPDYNTYRVVLAYTNGTAYFKALDAIPAGTNIRGSITYICQL